MSSAGGAASAVPTVDPKAAGFGGARLQPCRRRSQNCRLWRGAASAAPLRFLEKQGFQQPQRNSSAHRGRRASPV